MKKKIIYRQGDVVLISAKTPTNIKPVEPDNGRVILAYGEVTGHAHALMPDAAPMVFDGQDRYIGANEKAVLRHEEHTHLPIIPADYKVVQQCEYSPEAIRRVAD